MNLPTELYLRFRLARLPVDSTIEWDGWLIRRDLLRFHVQPPDCEELIPAPAKGAPINNELTLLRAVSCAIALVLGEQYAPELPFKNICRRGNSYEAWHYDADDNRYTPVLYAETAQDAHECYQAWKAAGHALIPHGRRAG